MKPLGTLNNIEKGRLLADLFPEEREGILTAIKVLFMEWKEQEIEIRKTWGNSLLTADFWYVLAERVNSGIEKHGNSLLKTSRRYSDNLFDGYDAIFTIDCIQKYAERGGGSDPFRSAVDMLFPFRVNDNKSTAS